MTNLEKVKELYDQDYGVTEIGKMLNMKTSNVGMYLNKIYGKDRPKRERYRYVNKKYTLNDRYFEQIDTEEKAYFLGLLYADGCISSDSNAIQIALQEEDDYILEIFKKCINSNKPLGFIKSREVLGFKGLHKKYYRKNQKIFVINSPRIKKQLLNLGLMSNKSLIITFPNYLSDTMLQHFIRGYFDGDGSISVSSKNKWSISIASNKEFSEALFVYLHTNDIKSTITKHYKNNVYYNRITGRLNCIDFYTFIYETSNVHLIRKFDKFQQCINSTQVQRYGNTWRKEKTTNA